MIVIKHDGDFKNTERFLNRMRNFNFKSKLEKYALEGVQALSSATPVASGLTASSWGYEIHSSADSVAIYWTNSNVVKGVPIAIILQYGHGTRNGGYVQGRDYINPAIRPVFDRMAKDLWKEVTSA